jgi:hypothetical protein
MLHRRKAEEKKIDEVENVIPDNEPTPPKPVKPLLQKHFKPILEEVASIKSMQTEIAQKQIEIMEFIKKNFPDKVEKIEKPVESEKPAEA